MKCVNLSKVFIFVRVALFTPIVLLLPSRLILASYVPQNSNENCLSENCLTTSCLNYDSYINTILSLSSGTHGTVQPCRFEPKNGDGFVDRYYRESSRGAFRHGSLHCSRSGISLGLATWGFPQDAITAIEHALQMQRQDYVEHISADPSSMRDNRCGEGWRILVSFMKLFRMRVQPEIDENHVRVDFTISSVVHELMLSRDMRENIEYGYGLLPNQAAGIRIYMDSGLARLTQSVASCVKATSCSIDQYGNFRLGP